MSIFGVPEMSNPGEARRVRRILGKLEGVREIDVNYITCIVSIRYDGKKLSLLSIKAAILKARNER